MICPQPGKQFLSRPAASLDLPSRLQQYRHSLRQSADRARSDALLSDRRGAPPKVVGHHLAVERVLLDALDALNDLPDL